MTIAQTLLADSTFDLMTLAEKLQEARSLIMATGAEDDPMAAAEAVEEAEGLALLGFEPTQPLNLLPADLELCREDRQSCASPVAGNGRCLECGARRSLPPTPDVRAWEPSTPRAPRVVVPARSSRQATNVLARFKGVSGLPDRDIADLLGMARSTVQATVSGRMPEILSPKQLAKVAESLAGQAKALQELTAEIEERVLG